MTSRENKNLGRQTILAFTLLATALCLCLAFTGRQSTPPINRTSRHITQKSPPPNNHPESPFNKMLAQRMQHIESALSEKYRHSESLALAEDIALEDIPATIDTLLASSSYSQCHAVIAELIRRAAREDLALAASLLSRLPPGKIRSGLFNELSIAWANEDPASAEQWVRQWPDKTQAQQGLFNIANETARADAPAAMEIAADLLPSPARDQLITHTAAQWASAKPADAIAWAMKIPASDLRDLTISAITTEWAVDDPATAANTALAQLSPGRPLDDTLIAIAQRWTQSDPTAALAWINRFPQGPLRDTALENFQKLRPSN